MATQLLGQVRVAHPEPEDEPAVGRLGAWGHLDSLDAAAARAYVRRVEELGYGTLWVPETVGREPFTLLGMLAGETSRLVLGTSIVGIWGH
ncbi:MAG: LLM class flavin-dependent oxidoreductase, partial [Candidatus Limnocylindria bacterium]